MKGPKDLLPVPSRLKAAVSYMARKKKMNEERASLGKAGADKARKETAEVLADARSSKGVTPTRSLTESELRRESDIAERKSSVGLESRTGEATRSVKPMTRTSAIQAGYFTEKDGDLVPTEKYYSEKRTGKLKQLGL